VLRGPQGTLYGRNATGGVVNVITAKPTDVFEGNVRAEYGNFNTQRLRGAVNIPITDLVALRLAGSMLKRDGFGENLVTGNDIDDRDLYAFRATLGFNTGGEGARAWLLYEHFEEDDNRARVGKQLCRKDVGPTSVGGVPILPTAAGTLARGFLSQGCLPSGITDPVSLGTLNSSATLGGGLGNLIG
jgi:outer membrane receptor protein involved in Fe transport